MKLKLFVFFSLSLTLFGQTKIDKAFFFRSEEKKYSLYIPSNYSAGNNAILAFHPLNVERWDAKSWRDTLSAFAEKNNVILICPDGGVDGKIDDEIDTAFTSILLDSVQIWYPYDQNKLVALGFSWGGRTTYTYSLARPDLIYAMIPIGAAIDGAVQFNGKEKSASQKNVYIIHGSNDNIAIRFNPAINFFKKTTACLFDTLMAGIDHTIDFPNRNNILSRAYQKVISNSCGISGYSKLVQTEEIQFHYLHSTLIIDGIPGNKNTIQIINSFGQNIYEIASNLDKIEIKIDLIPGIYYLQFKELHITKALQVH